MKKNHKNDKRRITAEARVERMDNVLGGWTMEGICKMLQDHARAAVARYKRKARNGR